MKYFTKEALLGFFEAPPKKAIKPKPFRTYEQTVESLPTYALRKRLNKLQSRAAAGNSTMSDNVRREYNNQVMPLLSELRARGENI